MKNFLKYPWLTIQHRWRKFWINRRIRKMTTACRKYALLPNTCVMPLIHFAKNAGYLGKEALADYDQKRKDYEL